MRTAIIFIVVGFIAITSMLGLVRLMVNYRETWKYKDLKPFDKFVVAYLFCIIALWFGFIIYAICKFPIIK